MEHRRLFDMALAFTKHELEDSTREQYEIRLRPLTRFCESNKLPFPSCDADAWILSSFIQHRIVVEKRAFSTIQGTMSAVSDVFRHSDQAPTATSIVRSARKAAAKVAPPKAKRNPVQRDHLLKIHAYISRCGWTIAKRRDFLALLLAYRGCMRGEEVTGLLAERVWIDTCSPEDQECAHFPPYMIDVPILWVQLSSSKTKPQKQRPEHLRQVETILIGPDALAALCPITHFKEWRARRDKSEKTLFYSARSNGGGVYSRSVFSAAVRDLAKAAGIPEQITGHSARAGCATTAIHKGVDIRLVKQHGRWKSDAVYDYIRDDSASKLVVSAALGGLGPFSSRASDYYRAPPETAAAAAATSGASDSSAPAHSQRIHVARAAVARTPLAPARAPTNCLAPSASSSSSAAAAAASYSSESTRNFYS